MRQLFRRQKGTSSPGSADPARPPTAGPLCRAPFSSLHLDPSGNVRVCELNSMAMLGNVASARLPDLWRGAVIGRIRSALDHHDLSVGCEGCIAPIEAGDRANAHAAYYDRFTLDDPAPAWPKQLELSLSNACNLQCEMCNGDLSSAIRAHREGLPPLPKVYDEQFFSDLAEFLPHLERVTFIGGEPFIGPESRRVLDLLADLGQPISINVSTNGTALTPQVERWFRALPIELCVSLDAATKATYDTIRVGSDWDLVMANLDRFADLASTLSVSICLMTTNWHEFGAFLDMAEDRGIMAHVNVVTAPRRFSLYHLGAHELDEVLHALRADGEQRGSFGRNQPVWDAQLRRLEAHLVALREREAAEQTVAIGVGATGTAAGALRIAERGADERGTFSVHVGHSEEVVAITPRSDDVFGMDLSPLVGGHQTAIGVELTAAFGPIVRSDLRYRPGGIEERCMVFERDGLRTTLLSALGPPSDPALPGVAATWHVGATDEPIAP